MKLKILTILFSFLLLLNGLFNMAYAHEVTLKEKIGQMLLIGFKGFEVNETDPIVQAILKQQIGGVILFDYDSETNTYMRNIKDPEQLKKLTTQLQSYNLKAKQIHKNHLSPLLIGIDYEGGKVNRLKESYGFSKTLSAAEISAGSKKQAHHYANQMADTLKNAGVNLNFAPVVDVNVNPNNFIAKKDRIFSDDPNTVIEYAAIFSQTYHKKHILCTYKHFPGHGSSTGDTHEGFVDVTQTWQPDELKPYKQLSKLPYACPIIMTAHVVHFGLDPQGYPASLSAAITTDLLRKKLHFNGVVITDDLQMGAVEKEYTVAQTVQLAVNAGADILVFGNQLQAGFQDPAEIIDMIYHDVKSGIIPESRINESYQRIMKLKKSLFISKKNANE